MSLLITLRHLEKENESLHLRGQLPAAALDMEGVDELIRVTQPLEYDLEAQKLDDGILVQGSLRLVVDCECARCLKPFKQRLELDHWACLLALEGEEKVAVINDCVDLTPIVREDILLEFPQHPLCKPECGGLKKKPARKQTNIAGTSQAKDASAWSELNKLKF